MKGREGGVRKWSCSRQPRSSYRLPLERKGVRLVVCLHQLTFALYIHKLTTIRCRGQRPKSIYRPPLARNGVRLVVYRGTSLTRSTPLL